MKRPRSVVFRMMQMPWAFSTMKFAVYEETSEWSLQHFQHVVLVAHPGAEDVSRAEFVFLPFAQYPGTPLEDQPIFVSIMKMQFKLTGVRHGSHSEVAPVDPLWFLIHPPHDWHFYIPLTANQRT